MESRLLSGLQAQLKRLAVRDQQSSAVEACEASLPNVAAGLQIHHLHDHVLQQKNAPLGVSFTQKLRPFIDVVDRLRTLGVSKEGINLPTIVVVGDQSSGKSSVLESLSGVELPKGQGTVTRVPLILRLKDSATQAEKITITYDCSSHKSVEISAADIASYISAATVELAGPGKAIANKPITLDVSRPGAPDLTLVDLPGITRVPIQGQPDNIYEKIQQLILDYIKPEETIILNVLSAAIDFSVCESIRMSRRVDQLGKRTLAVVTKVDICPDGLLQKITDDAVKIGLGYICVRNRTSKEASFEEAEEAERELFSSHAELRKLGKFMAGIQALANRLVQLQTETIARILPRVLRQIDSSLEAKREELQKLSGDISNVVDASVVFFNVSVSIKKSLQDILLLGNDEDLNSCAVSCLYNGTKESQMHYTASLHAEFERFTAKITPGCGVKSICTETTSIEGYLKCIQRLLNDSLGTNLPNVVPQAVIEKMVRQLLDSIASICTSELPSFVHDAAHKVALFVVAKHAGRFPTLKKLYTAAFQKGLSDCKSKCCYTITRLLEMEKAVVYTTGSDLYNCLVNKFMQAAAGNSEHVGGPARSHSAHVEGLGSALNLGQLAMFGTQKAVQQAACNVLAYWIILSRRLADQITHELRFSTNEALLNVTDQVVGEVAGGTLRLSIEEIMAEQPEVEHERLRLRTSIDMLCTSKDLVTQVLGEASIPF